MSNEKSTNGQESVNMSDNNDNNNNSNNPFQEYYQKYQNHPMLWWVHLDMWKNPGTVLLISSIPFGAGAYFGYRKPSEKLEELVGSKNKMTNATTNATANATATNDGSGISIAEGRRLGLKMASRALRLATLGTFGTFGFLGAVGFYASGYQSVEECIQATTRWATGWRQSFEDWMGIEDRPSQTHPEVVATKDMTEDEVLDYIYDKYIKEPEEENNEPKA